MFLVAPGLPQPVVSGLHRPDRRTISAMKARNAADSIKRNHHCTVCHGGKWGGSSRQPPALRAM
jgi:hypothetical protein